MRRAALALLLAAVLAPAAQAAPAKPNQCFFDHDWNGWRAIDNGNAMYLRVGLRQIYKVEFVNGCSALTWPNAHLVTTSRTDSVCSALDLDIKVSQNDGFSTACIASKLTPLTKEEVGAIPKKQLP